MFQIRQNQRFGRAKVTLKDKLNDSREQDYPKIKLHEQTEQNFKSGEQRIKERDQMGVLVGENTTNSLTKNTLIGLRRIHN